MLCTYQWRLSLAATSPSFIFSCYAMLRSSSAFFLVRSSMCQQSAGEIRRLEFVFTAYTLSIIARCLLEAQLVVSWRVRLLDCVDLLLFWPTICLIQRGSFRGPGR